MGYDAGSYEGIDAQRKEYMYKRLIAARPDFANRADLMYDASQVELEFYRGINDGSIPNNVNTNTVSILPGLKWGFLGDSITNGSNAANFSYAFASQAVGMAGALYARPDSFAAGVPGNTSAQMLARMDAFLANNPEGIVILAGTNDASQGVSIDTYISNMRQIITRAKSAGCAVIICTVPPKSSSATATVQGAIIAQNMWIRTVTPSLGCEVAHTYSGLVDTTTGYLKASYDSGDGTHPNGLGHIVLGQKVAEAMKRIRPLTGYAIVNSTTPVGAGNLITDPLSLAGSTKPSGWFEQPGGTGSVPTYSLVNDASGALVAGKWAQMDFDASGANTGGLRTLASPTLNTAVGDLVALTVRIQIEDVSGDWVNNVGANTAGVSAILVNQSGVTVPGFSGLQRNAGIKSPTTGFYDIGPVFFPVTIPSGTTSVNFWGRVTVPTGSRYKVRFGELGVINLTAQGAANAFNWLNVVNTVV